MKLCFARGDVMQLRFNELDDETALPRLLALALKGGGMEQKEAEEKAERLIALKGEGELARFLERAATDALNLEREKARIRRQEYTAWRIGYYMARALGTFNEYPQRP